MYIIKRDGTKVEYNDTKIKNAIAKANSRVCSIEAMTDEDLNRITTTVTNKIDKKFKSSKNELSVEEIQDLVEDTLMKSKFNQTAKSYILYREKRTRERENKTNLMQAITKKIMATEIVNQNANVEEASFGGRKGEANNELMKWFALNNCMSEKSRYNHLNNRIYIHDLDSYSVGMHNCLSVPFDHLLADGFDTRQTDIRPANSINTAFQLIAVIFQLQSLQQFGGVSATHLDWTMVPYVRKSFRKFYMDGLKYLKHIEDYSIDVTTSIDDRTVYNDDDCYNYAKDLTIRTLKQAVEGMYHNLNTLQSRSGNQLPFTSINYGTCTLTEGRMVTKALLEGSLDGVGRIHKTPIFPCGIFQYKKGINDKPGTPNYDLYKLALKSTARRLYPNYANCDWSNDVKGLQLDRMFKKETIEHLSRQDYDTLLNKLKEHPEFKDMLLLDVVNDNIVVKHEATPMELFSTMGCHAKDTLIRMYDDTLKPVQEIIVGDKLKGTSDKPRLVQTLIKGHGRMFKIKQSNACDYVVNEYHILSLCRNNHNEYDNPVIVNISVHDYLNLSEDTQAELKGYKIKFIENDGHKEKVLMLSDITIEEVEQADFYGFELDGDKLYMLEDSTVTHNCRTANGYDINAQDSYIKNVRSIIDNNKLYDDITSGAQKDGRGNICPVTIILPTIAMEAKENNPDDIISSFMNLLDKTIDEAKDMLIERFNYICAQDINSAKFMYNNRTMFGLVRDEGIKSALKHGTIVIGQIGLAETLQILIGKNQLSDEGMELAKRIEKLFNAKCQEFKNKYKLNFGVYYTPAENLCYTAMKKFKAKYGEIKNVSDRDYFTNSIHVPVWEPVDPFRKIDVESQLTGFSNAGCITYVELEGAVLGNLEALESIVNYAMNHDIPYFAVNVPNDTCLECGYTGEFNDECPVCHSNHIQQLRRVTGYLTGNYTTAFNKGKQAEVRDRVKHA